MLFFVEVTGFFQVVNSDGSHGHVVVLIKRLCSVPTLVLPNGLLFAIDDEVGGLEGYEMEMKEVFSHRVSAHVLYAGFDGCPLREDEPRGI